MPLGSIMINLLGKQIQVSEPDNEEDTKKPDVPKLFDWLKAINQSKDDLRRDDPSLVGFEPFIITKGLGQSETTIGFANIMNKMPHIPKDMVYLFYLNGVPKHRAYAKWAKNSHGKDLKPFMEMTGVSREKALEALRVLTKAQIKRILRPIGGKIKN